MRLVDHKFLDGRSGYIGQALDVVEKSFDDERRSFKIVMTEERQDRAHLDSRGKPAGDIIRVGGVDTKDYERNPVLLAFHDYHRWPLGHTEGLTKQAKRMTSTACLAEAGVSVDADTCWGLVRGKHQKGVSVGLIPWVAEEIANKETEALWMKPRDILKSYLLEVSMAPIPMLQSALVTSKDAETVVRDLAGYNQTDDWERLVLQARTALLWIAKAQEEHEEEKPLRLIDLAGSIKPTRSVTLEEMDGAPLAAMPDGVDNKTVAGDEPKRPIKKTIDELARQAVESIKGRPGTISSTSVHIRR